jgi:hypothetical protein
VLREGALGHHRRHLWWLGKRPRVPPHRIHCCRRHLAPGRGPPGGRCCPLDAAHRGLPQLVTGEGLRPLRAPPQGHSTAARSISSERAPAKGFCERRCRRSRSSLSRASHGRVREQVAGVGKGRDKAILFLRSTRTIVRLRSTVEESRTYFFWPRRKGRDPSPRTCLRPRAHLFHGSGQIPYSAQLGAHFRRPKPILFLDWN